ncbi:hypothetical protein LV716_10235 [Flagellimonas sp. HMM57]|uniref:hypothetical protein n=1 Tax=unclassified Flagellimonas TaxID=2644544 RepID=UPI0013D39895|nr:MULTISPECIES: hypothetical protein [unclassified Flagellimonas]UII74647.1 hypothetical protein LV716_10235 [Flagellimonas sp. HMM57]
MKHHILYVVALVSVITNNGYAQKQMKGDSIPKSSYSEYGVNIYFKGSIEIIKNDFEEAKGYFYKAYEIIRFNKNRRIIASHSQHLISENMPPIDSGYFEPIQMLGDEVLDIENDSRPLVNKSKDSSNVKIYASLSNFFSYHFHLSSLYILPKDSKRKLLEEIELYINRHPPYKLVGGIEEVEIGNKKALKFLVKNGKTRLNHYIIFGKGYNYLFVSSPYGEDEVIQDVINEMILDRRNTTKNKRH